MENLLNKWFQLTVSRAFFPEKMEQRPSAKNHVALTNLILATLSKSCGQFSKVEVNDAKVATIETRRVGSA